MALCRTFSTSVTVPAARLIAAKFSVSQTAALLPLSLYTLGLAFGPLLFAPLSEVFGRRPIYIVTFSFLLLFTGLGTLAPNFASFLIFRFLAGFLGSSSMAIGAGTVADIWHLQTAGGTVGLFFILGPFLGPIFGPVAGSYILAAQDQDWRWTQWLILIIGAPIFLALLLTKETSMKQLSNTNNPTLGVVEVAKKIRGSVLRAIRMLFGDIVVLSLSLYTAYAYALTFSYFASIPYVVPRYYGLGNKKTSLFYLSILIGYLFAVALFAYFDRTLYARARVAAQGSLPAPEHRLYSALVGSVFLPIGLFWYHPSTATLRL
jgi:MFS family permease